MADDDRKAESLRAKIDALVKDYEAASGDKLLVRRLKEYRPEEIWAWIDSLAHEYKAVTGRTIKFEVGPPVSRSATPAKGAEQPSDEPTKGPTLYCSFCGKNQHEVSKLIAGPKVCICDECVELCGDIVDKAANESEE